MRKNLTIILLLLVPLPAIAQDYPGMNQIDMQKIHKMQQCMANIDQKQLAALEQDQKKFDTEIKSLCSSGNRAKAQAMAMEYAKKMMNKPVIKAMQKCGEMAKGMMRDMPFMDPQEENSTAHVCDDY